MFECILIWSITPFLIASNEEWRETSSIFIRCANGKCPTINDIWRRSHWCAWSYDSLNKTVAVKLMGLALVTCMCNRVTVASAGLLITYFYLHIIINPASSLPQSELWSLGRCFVFRILKLNRARNLKKILWSALGDQLEKYSRQRQIFSRQFV